MIQAAPSVDALNEARRNANRARASALMLVADGLLNPVQYTEQAATAAGRPLRRTTIYQLLLNQPGWGRGRANEVIHKVSNMHDDPNVREMTVGWAIDGRAHGRRFQSLADSLRVRTAPVPWPGFPFLQGPNYE